MGAWEHGSMVLGFCFFGSKVVVQCRKLRLIPRTRYALLARVILEMARISDTFICGLVGDSIHTIA